MMNNQRAAKNIRKKLSAGMTKIGVPGIIVTKIPGTSSSAAVVSEDFSAEEIITGMMFILASRVTSKAHKARLQKALVNKYEDALRALFVDDNSPMA